MKSSLLTAFLKNEKPRFILLLRVTHLRFLHIVINAVNASSLLSATVLEMIHPASPSRLPSGSWPVMLTPFHENGEIDFPAVERLVEWYISQGSAGLFATCQSSEIFDLSFSERLALIRTIIRRTQGRVPIVAGGVISTSIPETISQIHSIAPLGVDAVVLLTNQLLLPHEPENLLYERLEQILSACPDVSFGLYECPAPYKRLLSPDAVLWCARTTRFSFMKETACDAAVLAKKVQAAADSPLGIYAADNPTLLASLQAGAHGYSGILANLWPSLFSEITSCWHSRPQRAVQIQNFIGPASFIISLNYPASAKHLLAPAIGCSSRCRVGFTPIAPAHLAALHQVRDLARQIL